MQSENVAKGVGFLIIQNVIGYLLSFLFYILIARVLGSTEVGKLSILLMISSVFSLTNLSINYALQKFIPTFAEEEKHEEISRLIRTGLITLTSISASSIIILTLLSAQISIIIFGSTLDTVSIITILLATFIANFTTVFGGAMLGFGMFKETAIQNILNTGLSRILAIVLAALGLGLIGVTLGWLITAFATLGFSLYVLRHHLHLKKGFSAKRILEFSLPIHLFTIITFIQGWADIAILYAVATNLSQIGTYYLVISGATILSLFYQPISMAILPALSQRYSQNGIEGITPMAETYIRLTCKILIPVGAAFAALSATALEAAYGPQYVSGALPFAILVATTIIPALSLLIVTIIQSMGNTRPLIIIGVASSIADIGLVASLANPLGGVAGVAGRVAFSTVGVALGYILIRSKIKLNIIAKLKKPLAAAVAIATPLYLLDQYLTQTVTLPLRLRAPVDIVAFIMLAAAFTYLTHYITTDDMSVAKQVMPRRLRRTVNKIEKIFVR